MKGLSHVNRKKRNLQKEIRHRKKAFKARTSNTKREAKGEDVREPASMNTKDVLQTMYLRVKKKSNPVANVDLSKKKQKQLLQSIRRSQKKEDAQETVTATDIDLGYNNINFISANSEICSTGDVKISENGTLFGGPSFK